jgi:hypothetical protein
LEIYNIFNYIGRSGTTFLRNMLLRMGDISCLETDQQFTWLHKYRSEINNFESVLPEAFIRHLRNDWERVYYKHDIRLKYGLIQPPNPRSLRPKLLFKIPGYVMALHCYPLFKFVRPILMLRHPVATVLSVSNPSFLKISSPLKLIYKELKDVQKMLGVEFAEETTEFNDWEMYRQIARILCLSIEIHKYIISEIICKDTLVIFFEDMCRNFEMVLNLISTFFRSHGDKLVSRAHNPFYTDVLEEGNIKMDEPLKPEKAWGWAETTDPDLITKIWSYVGKNTNPSYYSKLDCIKSSFIWRYSNEEL